MSYISIQAFDIGGTWTRAVNISSDKKFGSAHKERTQKDFITQIKRISYELIPNEKERKLLDYIAVILPGPVENGILLAAPPLALKKPLNFKKKLAYLIQGSSTEIFVENDLTAAVYAELYYGHGKHWDNFYLLTLSTGIGVGIVINREVVRGGEFGHNKVVPREAGNRKCICGRTDCWCAFSSGKGIESLIKDIHPKYETVEKICREYKDQAAKKIIDIARNANAQGLAHMINALEMQGIVIMGSLGIKQFDILIPNTVQIQEYTINKVPPIVKTELGDNIGLQGVYKQLFPS